eukprot:m.92005 g.92005  ORF g.92005 m.92005 type:complete len:455 (+) comp18261_c0_seq3:3-1367(+)
MCVCVCMYERKRTMKLVALVFLLAAPSLQLDNGLGLTPPLAWSSWNFFANGVNESVVLETADALISTGLRAVGYEYVNIDAGYLLHSRDASGHLQVNPEKFPHGMKFVADQLHAKGLKLGVYTDISNRSCGIGPGSLGHYDTDAQTFASWGVDYLKVDYCGPQYVSPDASIQYQHWQALGEALNRTGRPIYYSICPHTYAPNASTAALYAGDLVYSPPFAWTADQRHSLANSILVEYVNSFDMWYGKAYKTGGIITNIDAMLYMTQLGYSTKGSWNDADMLQVCNYGKGATPHSPGGMTLSEYRAHYAVWSVMASPLILGFDVRSIAKDHPDCLALLTNPEVVAVNQDPAGLPAFLVSQETNSSTVTSISITSQVLARPLQNKGAAVVLLNRAEFTQELTVSMSDLGFDTSKDVLVARDVFQRKTLPPNTLSGGYFAALVPPHDVVMLTIAVKS